jgi:prepilin-type N-terminal cleavage/methylation domain-containing protein/prepilin-type processing-associated H-X9-DG protein
MSALLRMKFWQWTLVGLVIGLSLAHFYADHDFSPHDPTARVELTFFARQVHSPPLPGGYVRATGITLYPMLYGVQLITYVSAEIAPDGQMITRHRYFYTGYSNIADRLSQLKVPFRFAWWADPKWSRTIWFSGAFVLVGIIWPTLLWQLKRLGLGPLDVASNYDLKRFSSAPEKKPPPAPTVSEATYARVREIDAALEAGLAQSVTSHSSQPTTAAAQHPASGRIDTKPLEPMAPKPPEEDKDYQGEFYPVARPHGKPLPGNPPHGFTLVELLVVIGIIGILLAILLPALTRANQDAKQIACAANLRSIGQGLSMYVAQNNGVFPPAYLYVGQSVVNGVELPPEPTDGYVHWSSYLYGSLGTLASAFQCPELDRGGLPPADPPANDFDNGQIAGAVGIVDQQVPRVAYTLNEAICPRNKFVLGYQGAVRFYQYVKASQVTNSSGTILATEFAQNAVRFADGNGFNIYSHRPVFGFVASNGTVEMYTLPVGAGFRQATAADLDPDPSTIQITSSGCVLNWVGRNHGVRTNYPDRRLTNFLYADGHVETKTVYDTLNPFQWGAVFWSLNPNGDLQTQ